MHCTHLSVHTRTHARAHTHTHTPTPTHPHPHTHTHIHTHTLTPTHHTPTPTPTQHMVYWRLTCAPPMCVRVCARVPVLHTGRRWCAHASLLRRLPAVLRRQCLGCGGANTGAWLWSWHTWARVHHGSRWVLLLLSGFLLEAIHRTCVLPCALGSHRHCVTSPLGPLCKPPPLAVIASLLFGCGVGDPLFTECVVHSHQKGVQPQQTSPPCPPSPGSLCTPVRLAASFVGSGGAGRGSAGRGVGSVDGAKEFGNLRLWTGSWNLGAVVRSGSL